jgi:hypothetical protein
MLVALVRDGQVLQSHDGVSNVYYLKPKGRDLLAQNPRML